MLTKEQNELLCRTGRETPCGQLFRRYWLPVGLSSDVKPGSKPRQVKLLGEDLVLFRDNKGRPGLLGLHCSHRLTSLAYGRVEDGGIRCPFHGWLYDIGGRCLEQPAEPEPFTDRIRHLAYPCEELGGLMFAYLGPPEKKPLLPRYEVLVREDGTRKADYYFINSNYLQNIEGADSVHPAYLHVNNWSKVKHMLASLPKHQIEFEETDYGMWQKTYGPGIPDRTRMGTGHPNYYSFFMPAGFVRIERALRRKGRLLKFQSWYVPIDDTHTMRFQVGFAPLDKDKQPYEWPSEQAFVQPGPENDYFRNYEEVDTISGIPVDVPGTTVKGFLVQDNMVNETQGPITDRSQEHLGGLDKHLTAFRVMLLLAIEAVRKGRDPKHIKRDPAENKIVYIPATERLELD